MFANETKVRDVSSLTPNAYSGEVAVALASQTEPQDDFRLAATTPRISETGEAHPSSGADLRHMRRIGSLLR